MDPHRLCHWLVGVLPLAFSIRDAVFVVRSQTALPSAEEDAARLVAAVIAGGFLISWTLTPPLVVCIVGKLKGWPFWGTFWWCMRFQGYMKVMNFETDINSHTESPLDSIPLTIAIMAAVGLTWRHQRKNSSSQPLPVVVAPAATLLTALAFDGAMFWIRALRFVANDPRISEEGFLHDVQRLMFAIDLAAALSVIGLIATTATVFVKRWPTDKVRTVVKVTLASASLAGFCAKTSGVLGPVWWVIIVYSYTAPFLQRPPSIEAVVQAQQAELLAMKRKQAALEADVARLRDAVQQRGH